MIIQPPEHLKQGYYTQAIEWKGLYVMAGPQVSALALYTAAETCFNMLRYRPDIVARLAEAGGRFAVAPIGGVAVDLPEFAYLKGIDTFDGRGYADVIGLGGVIGNPVSSSAEHTILKLPSDPYLGKQNIMLHEAAHLFDNVGFDRTLANQLTSAYNQAMSKGLWPNSYAASNSNEYFAVVSEAFFGHSREDATMTHINTREELRTYDPAAYALAVAVYGNDTWNDGDWIGTDGADTFRGSDVGDFMVGMGGNDTIYAGGGDDHIIAGTGSNYIDGGAGFDLVLFDTKGAGRKSVASADNTYTLTIGNDVNTLINVERVKFTDGVLAYDIEGNAGQAYRLYQAMFERAPDNDGLKYWVGRMDQGKADLIAIADSFIYSPEFVRKFGTNDTVSNGQFVELLYKHTLGRTSDQDGLNYWTTKLDTNQTNRRDVLAFFSESNENKANVIGLIEDGIWIS